MGTAKQQLGDRGEAAVCRYATCPRCNREKSFRRLRGNFECVDVICKFCGYLAQVKATRLKEGQDNFPNRIPAGAWGPQHERLIAGVFHGLYVVGYRPNGRTLVAMDYIPPHVIAATPEIYEPRKPLSKKAQRSGWAGYTINLGAVPPVGRAQVYPKP